MKTIVRPIYILLFVTLPQLLLLGYLVFGFGLSNIERNMLIVSISIFFNVFFSIYALLKRKEDITDIKIFIAISVLYMLFIASGISLLGESFSLMNSPSSRLVFITVCMFSVLYGMFGIAHHTTSSDKEYNLARYSTGIIIVPPIWFIIINLIHGINSSTIMMIFIIASVYAILLLAVKILFIWRIKKYAYTFDTPGTKKYYIATTIITLLMPLGGLALNQLSAGLGNGQNSIGLFGDFTSPIYYIIAIINGILMLIPPIEDKRLRIIMFYLKAVCYTYILYFLIVFLPIMPLGAIGIIFYGLGVFIFAPAAAAIWQGIHLWREWKVLSQAWGIQRIIAVFCIGIVTLPICVASVFWGDKDNFAAAAQYLEQNKFENMQLVSLSRLERTLRNMKSGLGFTGGRIGFAKGNTPIISTFYTQFILDGKMVSQENIMTLENMFFDAGHNLSGINLSDPNIVNNRVQLIDAVSETRFDEESGVYKSWVHLKLKNPTNEGNGEYITTFKLPEGVYISDYYLDVLGNRKEGILTDRRAALFIYRKIVNTRRDPGLLHYIGKNTLELRVFPFEADEIRETGFEIIHDQKFNLNLDHKSISVGGNAEQKEVNIDGAVLLSSAQKAHLQSIQRVPKYYFVVDSSKNSNIAWHVQQIEEYAKIKGIIDANVIFASYKTESYPLADMKHVEMKAEYGFNLNQSIRMILSEESDKNFPVIIAVSDNMPGAIFPQNIYPLSDRFPESPYYYALNHNLTLAPYSYEDNKIASTVKSPIVEPILDYHGGYVSDNNQNELVLTGTQPEHFDFTGNQYKDAVLLDASQQRGLLKGESDSLELLRASFRAKILTPQTAFIVVETPQQEKELFDLQERIINNNEQIPSVTLNEPPVLVYSILFMFMIWFIKMHKIKLTRLKNKFTTEKRCRGDQWSPAR
ncbi:MAG: MSEP-CTERM sorting domain-containing protein [Clostridia bacterium]